MSPTPSRARRLRFLLVIAALALGSLVTVTDASARRRTGVGGDEAARRPTKPAAARPRAGGAWTIATAGPRVRRRP